MRAAEDTAAPPCGHHGCRTTPIERRAATAAATVLDDPDLTRVCDQDPTFVTGGPIPDFHSPRHVVEVKELTSEPLRRFIAAYDALPGRYIPIPTLQHLWGVSLDVSAAHQTYEGRLKTPRVKTLINSLTQFIGELESRGITDAFTDHDNWPRFAEMAGFYGHCAVLPSAGLQPGIMFSGTMSEQPRTTHLDDDVAPFLQDWLDEHSDNACQSLAGRAGVHVAALVASLDGPAAGMIHTMMETPGEAPTAMLRLPAEIDVLIVVANADVLSFATGGGWSRRSIPPHL
ncbi:hypothetical protein H7J86_14590 [Mycobacterium hackensackense]|uniref:hypothetical protein n=1 Tax=Mycobacterium hackensackense TaxID=228909 RepID=UPI0022659F0E|nr:hypothetical protein [Mycobacterium hackensackense]MCV7253396.1 hypothetical protein [Mycobacterium hackensackense]